MPSGSKKESDYRGCVSKKSSRKDKADLTVSRTPHRLYQKRGNKKQIVRRIFCSLLVRCSSIQFLFSSLQESIEVKSNMLHILFILLETENVVHSSKCVPRSYII